MSGKGFVGCVFWTLLSVACIAAAVLIIARAK